MVTLLLVGGAASAVEIGLGARNNLSDQLFIDAPQLVVRQGVGHLAIEGYAAYGVSQAPSALSTVLLDRSTVASTRPVRFLDHADRLSVGALGSWDLGSPLPPGTGLSGSPHLLVGAEVLSWQESVLRFGPQGAVSEPDSTLNVGAGPVFGLGLNLRLERFNLRFAMLDRTVIGPEQTINARAETRIVWAHSPTITVDALWNLGRSK